MMRDKLDLVSYNYIGLGVVFYLFNNGKIIKENFYDTSQPD
jgi:hypothetical protein